MKRKRKNPAPYKFFFQPELRHFFHDIEQISGYVRAHLPLPKVLLEMVLEHILDGFTERLAALATVVEMQLRSKEFYAGRTLYRVPNSSKENPLYLELTVSQCTLRKAILYVVLQRHESYEIGDLCMTFKKLTDSKFLRGRQDAKQKQQWCDLGLKTGNIFTEIDWLPSLTPLPYISKFQASNLEDWIHNYPKVNSQILQERFNQYKQLSIKELQVILRTAPAKRPQ